MRPDQEIILKKDYIQTVAHLFQNINVSTSKLYVGKNGEFEGGDWFSISENLRPMISPHRKDAILIPLNYDYSAAAFNIEKKFCYQSSGNSFKHKHCLCIKPKKLSTTS